MQALIDYKTNHTREELTEVIKKMRVFENGAQDNAGAWICSNYPDIHWIRSNYQTYCYGGPRVWGELEKYDIGPYTWEPYEYTYLGQHHWALDHIIVSHGQLGKNWPLRIMNPGHVSFLEGGGTIPWMGLIHKGLSDINKPDWGGWSGRFTREKVKNEWSRHKDIQADEEKYDDFYLYTETEDHWVDPESGVVYDNEFTPVWRWRRAMYNDFMCRMDWCVEDFENANHNPMIVIDGDSTETILFKTLKAGDPVSIDGSATFDPDQDAINYSWWIYKEAGTYQGDIDLKSANRSKISFQVPKDASGKKIHLVFEGSDVNPIASLYDYRRIVINVE